MQCVIFLYILFAFYERVASANSNFRLCIKENKSRMSTADTFHNLIQSSSIFLDKSLLLETIFDPFTSNVMVISLPSQWGKSVNLGMIEMFCQPQLDVPLNRSKSYRFFVNGEIVGDGVEKLRKPLLIAENERIVDQYLGKYPVISINLKKLVSDNCDVFLEQLKSLCSYTYAQHSYIPEALRKMVEKDGFNEDEKELYKSSISTFDSIVRKEAKFFKLFSSFKHLSEMLYYVFNRQVIFLVDEYDSVIKKLFLSSNASSSEKEKIFKIYQDIFDNFNENVYAKKIIISGILPISKELLFSKFHNIEFHTVFDGNVSKYFGVHEAEADLIFDELKIPQDELERIKLWYKGYTIDESGSQAYNPGSLANYLNKRRFVNYCIRPENNVTQYLQKFLEDVSIKEDIEKLVSWQNIETDHCDMSLNKNDLILLGQENLTSNNTLCKIIMFKFLIANGYFTRDVQTEAQTNTNRISIKIPNMELFVDINQALNSFNSSEKIIKKT